MRAMVLREISQVTETSEPLLLEDWPQPRPGPGEVLLRVHCCGVCHTELDEIEGRAAPPALPVIPGHEAVGEIIEHGAGVGEPAVGTRVGVAWIFSACGECSLCLRGEENLCPRFRATGRDAHGGYAEYMSVPAAFVHPLPEAIADEDAAPMLCAGAIGRRSLRLTGIANGQVLGLTGFGGSNHQVLDLARCLYPDSPILVWARDPQQRRQALEAGARWAGDTMERAPLEADAIIDTTPVWKPVLAALEFLAPGGRLVINAIRKESRDRHLLADLDYAQQLWKEKEIKSVANVTRADVREFLQLAAEHGLRPKTETLPLAEANRALRELRTGPIRGAKVLKMLPAVGGR